jgi:hypothetical protein
MKLHNLYEYIYIFQIYSEFNPLPCSLSTLQYKTFIASDTIVMFPRIMTQYTKITNKMQLCRINYYSLAALHVLSEILAHHQEHLNCITASGITCICHCWLVSWECWNSSNTPTIPAGSNIRV